MNIFETTFSAIFLFEFALKSLAMGLVFEKNTYLRDGWNIIDFVVVISSILNFLPNTVNFSAIRTIRILRPLRSINTIKGTSKIN
jgi:hypothetical protein